MPFHTRSKKDQEAALQEAAHRVLELAVLPETPLKVSEEAELTLAEVAEFVAVARTGVKRDGYSREIDAFPEPEIGTRLVKQLVGLAQGIAMARESQVVTMGEVGLVQGVAFSCIPPMRWRLLQCLTAAYPKAVTVGPLVHELRLKGQSVRRSLEDLFALGIVDQPCQSVKIPTVSDDWVLNEDYAWLLCGAMRTAILAQKSVFPISPLVTNGKSIDTYGGGANSGKRNIRSRTEVGSSAPAERATTSRAGDGGTGTTPPGTPAEGESLQKKLEALEPEWRDAKLPTRT